MSDVQPHFGPREALSLDQLMERAGLTGWPSLDKLLDPRAEMPPDALEKGARAIAPILAAFAATAEGREILEWLADITVRRPHYVHGMTMEQAAMYAAGREGQDGVLFTVLKTIATGEAMAAEGGDRVPLKRRGRPQAGQGRTKGAKR